MNYKVLLFSGFGGSKRDFNAYTKEFQNFKVVDFSQAITVDDHLNIVDKIMKKEIEKLIIIGISWGAIIALYTAEKYREKIETLILCGAGRKMMLPQSLTMIMKLPFILFCTSIILFILSFPLYYIFDHRGYKQKYGGLGVLRRYGWKHTHEVYNKTLLNSTFGGKLHHSTLFINLTTDYLVNLNEINDLIETSESNSRIDSKLFDLSDQHHIHFTHELDELVVAETRQFLQKINPHRRIQTNVWK